MGEKRDDLAEAAIARQLDIEAQIPLIERTIAECADDEKELEGFVAALLARKREMEEELRSFREARRASLAAEAPAKTGSGPADRADRATSAFDRVMARHAGVAGTRDSLEGDKRMAELDELARNNRVKGAARRGQGSSRRELARRPIPSPECGDRRTGEHPGRRTAARRRPYPCSSSFAIPQNQPFLVAILHDARDCVARGRGDAALGRCLAVRRCLASGDRSRPRCGRRSRRGCRRRFRCEHRTRPRFERCRPTPGCSRRSSPGCRWGACRILVLLVIFLTSFGLAGFAVQGPRRADPRRAPSGRTRQRSRARRGHPFDADLRRGDRAHHAERREPAPSLARPSSGASPRSWSGPASTARPRRRDCATSTVAATT